MLVRSISGLDRMPSSNYMMLAPGVPVFASTPAVAHNDCDRCNAPQETTIVAAGIVSSLLVFLMWVGAWGAIDALVTWSTDSVLYQIGIYFSIALVASFGMWLQLADWRKSVEDDDSTTV
jgi:hypothetical protein